jgi:aryl-alcohol dehydrogenase-like predicted oxidoreductase
MKAMRKLVQTGRIRSVGISNFNLAKTKAAQEALLPQELVSNQVKYNLLDRKIEGDLLPYAQTSDITIIAYSPLAQSLLTGRYTPPSKPTSLIQAVNPRFSSQNPTRLGNVLQTLSNIGNAHGKTPSQVALNWLISKPNVVAIPGSKKPEHVADSAGATGWRLSESEVEKLDSAAAELHFDRLSIIPNLLRALAHI